ncbi:MAG: hypothetical protein ABR961_09835 [Thermoanaerobaculaceae bacterium]
MNRRTLLGMPALALAAVAGAGVPAVGRRAPAFTLPSSGGGTHSLAEVTGKKNLVLVFFRGVW